MELNRRTDDLQDKNQASSLLPSNIELQDVDRTGCLVSSMVDRSFLPPVNDLFVVRKLFILLQERFLPAVMWIFTAGGVSGQITQFC